MSFETGMNECQLIDILSDNMDLKLPTWVEEKVKMNFFYDASRALQGMVWVQSPVGIQWEIRESVQDLGQGNIIIVWVVLKIIKAINFDET